VPRWLIGTSGFSYEEWRGPFDPPGLARRRWLEFYGHRFNAVERNVTFYRPPRESTLRGWKAATDPQFRFVLKLPRLVSHVKRLTGCGEALERFWGPTRALGERLAATLLQTPPTLPFDPTLLDGFLGLLPAGFPAVAWEVRHPSFLSDDALAWFAAHRQPLVVAESGGRFPTVRAYTGEPVYLRFHGPKELNASPYTEGQLAAYVEWVSANIPAPSTVCAFFNNDVGARAMTNARQLRAVVGATGEPGS
jgi:uncharacterized protein YecE (DUF72 family)